MRATSLFIAVAICLLITQPLIAQQDTTPPVLLDFTISPVVFDAGQGEVSLDWCVTVRDDLSGIRNAVMILDPEIGMSFVIGLQGDLEETACGVAVIRQFTAYATYLLSVRVEDQVENKRIITNTELCDIATCQITNRPEDSLPDRDSDGIPDDADNCPTIANPNQEDPDFDLIGAACDPFPDDRDNAQAQCEADLAICLATGISNADGDGEADQTDKCPNTLTGVAVDDAGCSQAQFCAAIDMSGKQAKQRCEQSDWLNNQPLDNHPNDCIFVTGGSGQNDLCVAK